jgi:hypothetical protein
MENTTVQPGQQNDLWRCSLAVVFVATIEQFIVIQSARFTVGLILSRGRPVLVDMMTLDALVSRRIHLPTPNAKQYRADDYKQQRGAAKRKKDGTRNIARHNTYTADERSGK